MSKTSDINNFFARSGFSVIDLVGNERSILLSHENRGLTVVDLHAAGPFQIDRSLRVHKISIH